MWNVCSLSCACGRPNIIRDHVIKWKHFPRYWPFVRGIHRSTVNSPNKGQWRGPLMFSLFCSWINGWVNKREAGVWDAIALIMTSLYCRHRTSGALGNSDDKFCIKHMLGELWINNIRSSNVIYSMMTSSNENIFRVTGHLCGESTGPRWIPVQRPVTRSFEVFFDLHPNKRLSKQWWGWWFETPSSPLWRHRNAKYISFLSAKMSQVVEIHFQEIAVDENASIQNISSHGTGQFWPKYSDINTIR